MALPPAITQATSSAEEEHACPICFDENHDNETQLVVGPCQHAFCRSCIERLLNTTPTAESSNAATAMTTNESSIITPTLGLCPICRSELYLFDLREKNTGRSLYHKDTDWSELQGSVYADVSQLSCISRAQPGLASFHFPDAETDQSGLTVPYLNLEKVPSLPTSTPERIVPFQNYSFHKETRTFAGELHFIAGDYDMWQVYLSFSSDWRFVARGLIRKKRRKLNSEQQIMKAYPMDGTWQVHAPSIARNNNSAAPPPTIQITVSAKVFTYDALGSMHMIKANREENRIEILNPATITTTTGVSTLSPWLVADWNWNRVEQGPDIGETIVWREYSSGDGNSITRTNGSTRIHQTWTRQSRSTVLPPDMMDRIGGRSGRVYQRISSKNSVRHKPTYRKESLWGNVFCQGFKVGLASYHFEPDDQQTAYISYENPATGQWPPLDNGMPIPSRVNFRNVSQPDRWTFRGEICWLQDFGTTWQGMARWEYEMKFDQEFMCIVDGKVDSWTVHRTVSYEMSRYGETLVYCNAGMFDYFKSLATDDYSHFQQQSTELRERLMNAGASVRTFASMHRILTAAQQSDESANPFDYNL